MTLDPAFRDFLIFTAWYAGIGIFVHLLCRFSEVLVVLRYADILNHRYRVETVKEAWALDRQYDSGMHGYFLCLAVWPLGVVVMPFMYFNAWFWLWTLPFRAMSIRLIPKWMTLTSILDKLNARRGGRLY